MKKNTNAVTVPRDEMLALIKSLQRARNRARQLSFGAKDADEGS